jgi:hypothetical protein
MRDTADAPGAEGDDRYRDPRRAPRKRALSHSRLERLLDAHPHHRIAANANGRPGAAVVGYATKVYFV